MAQELIGINGQLVQLQLTAFEKRLLSRFRAEATFSKYGMKRQIGRHQGKAINFRRLETIFPAGNAGSLANASAPDALTEGTYPAEIQATWTSITMTLNQFGQWMKVSDLLETQSIDDVMPEFTEALAESMRDAIDLVTRDVLVAGTNRQYAGISLTRGGASGVGSGMYLNLAELREAKRTLMRANARPIREAGGKYLVITHPDVQFDLEADTNIVTAWQDAGARGMGNQIFDTQFKDLPMGFRVLTTTNARVFASLGLSGANVYITHVLAEEAYGTADYAALPARIIKHERGSSGIADPLDQAATVGWKASWNAVILNQSLHVAIEHASRVSNAA